MFTWKKYVCEVYRERSFSKAAQNLYISQPSLSARIKKVEEQIGVPLFDRSTSPLQLTEAGRIYIRAAEEISEIEQRVENAINNLNTLQTGRLSIGASNLFAVNVFERYDFGYIRNSCNYALTRLIPKSSFDVELRIKRTVYGVTCKTALSIVIQYCFLIKHISSFFPNFRVIKNIRIKA